MSVTPCWCCNYSSSVKIVSFHHIPQQQTNVSLTLSQIWLSFSYFSSKNSAQQYHFQPISGSFSWQHHIGSPFQLSSSHHNFDSWHQRTFNSVPFWNIHCNTTQLLIITFSRLNTVFSKSTWSVTFQFQTIYVWCWLSLHSDFIFRFVYIVCVGL